MNISLTQERLKELLHYDTGTGEFTRIASVSSNAKSGDVAGRLTKAGYCYIGVDGKEYLAHRLAWLYVHGIDPANDIDHIDGVRSNNRLSNLREATRAENMQNQYRSRIDNKSGLLGVYRSKGRNKWQAKIAVNGRHEYLGAFDTPELASAAYLSAKAAIHPFSNRSAS